MRVKLHLGQMLFRENSVLRMTRSVIYEICSGFHPGKEKNELSELALRKR